MKFIDAVDDSSENNTKIITTYINMTKEHNIFVDDDYVDAHSASS